MTVELFDNVKSLIDDVEVMTPSHIIANDEIELIDLTDNGQNSYERSSSIKQAFLSSKPSLEAQAIVSTLYLLCINLILSSTSSNILSPVFGLSVIS